jgi:predicted nucleic acid-binding Zn ribbon protein
MERAGRVIGKLQSMRSTLSDEERACAAWRAAVGRRLAARTEPERLVRGRLVVGVEDEVWRRQLFTMSRMILAKIHETVGPGVVEELEFRVAPARRGPQRAVAAAQAIGADEADAIGDPGMRRLYLMSRKRELA